MEHLNITFLSDIIADSNQSVNMAREVIENKTFILTIEERNQACRDFLLKAEALLSLILSSFSDSILNEGTMAELVNLSTYFKEVIKCMERPDRNELAQDRLIAHSTFMPPSSNEFREVWFHDIIGSDSAKQSLRENIIYQFTFPEELKQKLFSGIRQGTGNVILYGPPGVGKTILAIATAVESSATFLSVNPSDIFSKFQGESERYVKQLFQYAHRLPRAVIFFDEFDSIALTRCSGDSSQSRKLLSELLLQLTLSNKRHHLGSQDYKSCETRPDAGRERGIGLEQEQVQEQGHGRGQVVVIAATNRIEDLDEAVVRRFECKVYVGLPSNQERCLLVSSFLKGVSSQLSKKDLIEIAIMTNGWSGSDIESLCREAAMGPLRLFLSTAVSQLCPVIAGERKEDISNSKRFKSNPLVSTSSPILPVTFRDFAEAHAKLLINSGDLNGGEDCCDLVSRCTDER